MAPWWLQRQSEDGTWTYFAAGPSSGPWTSIARSPSTGDGLDLPVAREFGAGAGRGIVFFAGGGLIEVVGRPRDRRTGPTGRRMALWLQVRDIESSLDELSGRGCRGGAAGRPRAVGADRGVDRRPRRVAHPHRGGAPRPPAAAGPARGHGRARAAMTATTGSWASITSSWPCRRAPRPSSRPRRSTRVCSAYPGWPNLPSWRPGAAAGSSAGAARVHLGVEEDFRSARKAHPALSVVGVEELCRLLDRSGHPTRRTEDVPGTVQWYVDDPFGNRIELVPAVRHRPRSPRSSTAPPVPGHRRPDRRARPATEGREDPAGHEDGSPARPAAPSTPRPAAVLPTTQVAGARGRRRSTPPPRGPSRARASSPSATTARKTNPQVSYQGHTTGPSTTNTSRLHPSACRSPTRSERTINPTEITAARPRPAIRAPSTNAAEWPGAPDGGGGVAQGQPHRRHRVEPGHDHPGVGEAGQPPPPQSRDDADDRHQARRPPTRAAATRASRRDHSGPAPPTTIRCRRRR